MKTNSALANEKGVALMMTLVVSAVVLGIMSTMLMLVQTGTKVSGLKKRYATALEAAAGGQGVMYEFVGWGGALSNTAMDTLESEISLQVALSNTCLMDKVNFSTADWDASCDSTLTIDPADSTSFDLSFVLGQYDVYTKIVHTMEGNSARGGGGKNKDFVITRGITWSAGGGGKAGEGGGGTVMHIPYLYAIEVETRNRNNSAEKARISLLYEY